MDLDVFVGDGFTVTDLALAINAIPYVPTRIRSLGWFTSSGISTTSIDVEMRGNVLTLVPAKARNAPPTPKGIQRRTLRPFSAIHLPQEVVVMADEVQNLRGFGTSDTETAQSLLRQKNEVALMDLDLTLEYQMLGAVKGQVLDADGTTVLTDMFTEFGVSQITVDMDLDVPTTEVKLKALAIKRSIEDELGGLLYRSIRVLCSASFFDALITHASVKEAFDRQNDGAFLREDNRSGFEFPRGVFWEEYRGSVNGVDFITDDWAYAVPEGVPQMFKQWFAPANYMETVNTLGVPRYQKTAMMKYDKGIEAEIQSNPITLNTRPRAVIKLTK